MMRHTLAHTAISWFGRLFAESQTIPWRQYFWRKRKFREKERVGKGIVSSPYKFTLGPRAGINQTRPFCLLWDARDPTRMLRTRLGPRCGVCEPSNQLFIVGFYFCQISHSVGFA